MSAGEEDSRYVTVPSADVPNPEAVDELLELVHRLMSDERTRGQTIDTKTSTLAGFSGAILALTATLGAALFDRRLGSIEPALQGLFVVAVTTLSAAATLAVSGVLRPQPRLSIAIDEIRRFRDFPLIATPKVDIQGQMLATTIDALARERRINDRKARLTQWSAGMLVGGYVAVAAMAVTFAVT
jgi:hypothetical protein